VAAAIRKIKSNDPAKWPERQRDLERRFQEIGDDWKRWVWTGIKLEERARALLAKNDSKK
jgi:hypothetical protein